PNPSPTRRSVLGERAAQYRRPPEIRKHFVLKPLRFPGPPATPWCRREGAHCAPIENFWEGLSRKFFHAASPVHHRHGLQPLLPRLQRRPARRRPASPPHAAALVPACLRALVSLGGSCCGLALPRAPDAKAEEASRCTCSLCRASCSPGTGHGSAIMVIGNETSALACQ